ncbi:hypothetical protein GCM10029963_69320 [Micromonospora andamanensis]
MESSSQPPSDSRRRRAVNRRHRAGIVPPAVLKLAVAEPATRLPESRPGVRRAVVPGGLLDLAAGNRAEEEDLAGSATAADGPRRDGNRRRRLTLTGLVLTAVLSAVMLVATLVNWAPDGPPPRELTTGERERLAAMRVTNYRELRAGLHVTAGSGATRTDLLGWVDWARGWPISTWGDRARARPVGWPRPPPRCWWSDPTRRPCRRRPCRRWCHRPTVGGCPPTGASIHCSG